MVIKGYRVGALVKHVGQEILSDNILTLGAGAAYNFFFSFFPLLLFAAPLPGLFGNKREVLNWIVGRLADAVPPSAFAPFRAVVEQVVFAPNAPGLVSIGAILALYSASNIFSTLMTALNIAYHVHKDRRPWWKQRLIQLAMVAAVGLLMTLAAIIMIAGPDIVSAVAKAVGLGDAAKWVWMILQFPVAFGFLVAALWLMYYALPDVRQPKAQILVGALVAAVLWVVATLAFRVYIVHFGSYNKAYGTIGAVLILLTWMYYGMVVVLAGGELNSALIELRPNRPAAVETNRSTDARSAVA